MDEEDAPLGGSSWSLLHRDLRRAVALFYTLGTGASVAVYAVTGDYCSSSAGKKSEPHSDDDPSSWQSIFLFVLVQLELAALCLGAALCLKRLLAEAVLLDPRHGGRRVEVWNARCRLEALENAASANDGSAAVTNTQPSSSSLSSSSGGVQRRLYRTTAEYRISPDGPIRVLEYRDAQPWEEKAVWVNVRFPSLVVRVSEPRPAWCYYAGGTALWVAASQTPRTLVTVDSWTLVAAELVSVALAVTVLACPADNASERLVRSLLLGRPLPVESSEPPHLVLEPIRHWREEEDEEEENGARY